MPFVGLEAEDTASTEQEEVSPAFSSPAVCDVNKSPSHGLKDENSSYIS